MVYRGLSRRHKIWLLPHPPSPVSKLDRQHTGRRRKRDNLLTGGIGWEGAKSYDRKPGSSINHSILSGSNLSETFSAHMHSKFALRVIVDDMLIKIRTWEGMEKTLLKALKANSFRI
jgi:hypothetical protein